MVFGCRFLHRVCSVRSRSNRYGSISPIHKQHSSYISHKVFRYAHDTVALCLLSFFLHLLLLRSLTIEPLWVYRYEKKLTNAYNFTKQHSSANDWTHYTLRMSLISSTFRMLSSSCVSDQALRNQQSDEESYLLIITGSDGVSFRLPQLFLSQHRLISENKSKKNILVDATV